MSKAAIFDLDGVVADTAELHYQAWRSLADRHGLVFSRSVNEQLKGVSRAASLSILLAGQPCENTLFQELLKEKNAYFAELLESLSARDILPGISELLEQLRANGISSAIASSSRNAQSIIDRIQLRGSFDAVSDGHAVTNSKPAPDVFIHAAGQLRVNCEDCIVFEDAVAGVLGAKAAGMQTIGVGDHVSAANPTLLVSSTREITLQKINDAIGCDYV